MPDVAPFITLQPPARLMVPQGDKFNMPITNGYGAGTWPTANMAKYMLFVVDMPITVDGVFIPVGTASGNVDVGLYDYAGNRLVSSGSTAFPANANTKVTFTATTLQRGSYWVGLAIDNITASTARFLANFNQNLVAMGFKKQATAFPLPNPATFASVTDSAYPCVALSVV